MDIVGSILKKMTAPPSLLDENQRKQRQKRLLEEKRQREEEQGRIRAFVQSVTLRLKSFDQDEPSQGPKLTFNPMPKPQRAIIHGAAESEGLVPVSFGEDEVDRHVVVYRQHTVPSEPELAALRRNEVYVPPDLEQDDTSYNNQSCTEREEVNTSSGSRKKRTQGQPEYLQKYQKVLGGTLAVAKEAARSTTTKRSYGFVSSEQKSDRRTIEETLADIRARKKKLKNNSEDTISTAGQKNEVEQLEENMTSSGKATTSTK